MMLLLLLLAIVSCVTHASEASGMIRGFTKMMNQNPAVSLVFDLESRGTKSNEMDASMVLQDCAATCENNSFLENNNSWCCSGGFSSLQMMYHGPEGTLVLPSDSSLDAFLKVDPCDTSELASIHNHLDDSFKVRFVDCNCVVPTTCREEDVALKTLLPVSSGTSVCLVATDATQLPTDLLLFFVEPRADDVLFATILSTSCSQPRAIRLGTCRDSPHYSVQPTATLQDPVLELIDATSAQDPTVRLSDCLVHTGTTTQDECCRGGASILHARLRGTTEGGRLILTNDSCQGDDETHVSNGYHRRAKKGNNSHHSTNAQSSSSVTNLRFVDCACLQRPEACQNLYETLAVGEGDDFCLVQLVDDRVSFANKLPTNVQLWFQTDNYWGSVFTSAAAIHTSCSKPILGWGVVFGQDDCHNEEHNSRLVDLSQETVDAGEIYIEFVNGISVDFYEAAQTLLGVPFDITFAECSCGCHTEEPTSTTSPRPLGPSRQTNAPSLAPPTQLPRGPTPSTTTLTAGGITPSTKPDCGPSAAPSTDLGTRRPGPPLRTPSPTVSKEISPSGVPSAVSTMIETVAPSGVPSSEFAPSGVPSSTSSRSPSLMPSKLPRTDSPTRPGRTKAPKEAPFPSDTPGAAPSVFPTFAPFSFPPGTRQPGPPRPPITVYPSEMPSSSPTNDNTEVPSVTPFPTAAPSPSRRPGPVRPPVATPAPSLAANCRTTCEEWIRDNCIATGDDGSVLFGIPCTIENEHDSSGRFLAAAITRHVEMIEIYEELLELIV